MVQLVVEPVQVEQFELHSKHIDPTPTNPAGHPEEQTLLLKKYPLLQLRQ